MLIIGLLLLVTAFSVQRDLLADKQCPPDLRNRVVGARLQKDGRSPYFYKWKQGDGYRYYDPNNFDTLKVANITGTPFFHHLLAPLADMPERRLSACWLAIEYGSLLLITLLAFVLAKDVYQQWTVLGAAGVFLLTEAWRMHVYTGQNYLCIPLLASIFFYFIYRQTGTAAALVAGTAAVCLVLIRPNAALFFLPLLFLAKNYSRAYRIVFLLPVLALTMWSLLSPAENYLWQQYRANVDEQLKLHQQLGAAKQENALDPGFPVWEGIDRAAINAEETRHPIRRYSENGNVFVLINNLFHTKLSITAIAVLAVLATFILGGLFYFSVRGANNNHPAALALMGYSLYMVTDLFSPIYRHQYYTVQWIFPVMLAAAFYTPSFKWPYVLAAAGLLLNIINISSIKMEHTMGEYLLFLALAGIALTGKSKQPV